MTAVGQERPPRLREALTRFATLLVDRYDAGDVLYQLAVLAAELTETTEAGVLLKDVDGDLRYAAASGPMAARLEAIQLELGEGPCMLAHQTGAPVLVADLSGETRFERFVPRAREQGVAAVFTLPLLHDDSSVGILDLYRDQPSPLTQAQFADARAAAGMATAAVLNRRLYHESVTVTERLQAALDARIVMEQAKGRVSERHGVCIERAEEIIHAYVRGVDRPLGEAVRDIAAGDLVVPYDRDGV